ncbi:MAG: ABC transporter permease [Verrucomicrobiota bacterium JB022]|nr:ABC transporter permease [Verrucomicrobiota bacterium JB022]
MKLNLFIAWRLLWAKKRAMGMSLAGIICGVGFFVLTQAQTSGFEEFFIRTIWQTRGPLRVQDKYQASVTELVARGTDGQGGFAIPLREGRQYVPGVHDPERVMDAVWQFHSVIGVSGVLSGKVTASSSFRSETAEVMGVKMRDHVTVSGIANQVRYGDISTFDQIPQSAVVGSVLAERLSLDIGSELILKNAGESRRYQVVAIFETGVRDYDKAWVFIPQREARQILNKMDGLTYLQVNLRDNDKAPQIAEQMKHAIWHDVDSWQESERVWLEVFRALRISSGITMSIIILIAGLGMFNTLAIIVMERQRDIAILRSMGYRRFDIAQIFLLQGAIVCAAGTVLGWIFAAALTYGVENLPIRIRGIFATDHFVVKWDPMHYVWAGVVTVIIVLGAAYIPARKAARIEPGDIIRGTSA